MYTLLEVLSRSAVLSETAVVLDVSSTRTDGRAEKHLSRIPCSYHLSAWSLIVVLGLKLKSGLQDQIRLEIVRRSQGSRTSVV